MKIVSRQRTSALAPAHLPAIAMRTNSAPLPRLARPLLIKWTRITTAAVHAVVVSTNNADARPLIRLTLSLLSTKLTYIRMALPLEMLSHLLLLQTAVTTTTTTVCSDSTKKTSIGQVLAIMIPIPVGRICEIASTLCFFAVSRFNLFIVIQP
jgi:hypothetical protein